MPLSFISSLLVKFKGKPDCHLIQNAILNQDLSAVKKLVYFGADLCDCFDNGNYAIHAAILTKNIKIIKFLLKRKRTHNLKNRKGETPFIIAAKIGDMDIISTLFAIKCDLSIRDNLGFLPLHHCVTSKNTKAILFFISNGNDINDQDNISKLTPLHEAVKTGDLNLVDFMLSKNANINAQSEEGTPFSWAACFGNIDIAKYLIEKGADTDLIGPGGSPLSLTANFGKDEMFKILLNRKPDSIEEIDAKSGENLLHTAAKNNNQSIVKFLLSKGANVQAKTFSGDNAFHLCMKQGHIEIAEILLKNGINPLEKCGNNEPAIFIPFYSKNNSSLVFNFLIKHGANINEKNSSGFTPLILAIKTKNLEFIEILLKKGANTLLTDSDGNTPLFYAKQLKFENAIQMIEKAQKGEPFSQNSFNKEKNEIRQTLL